MFQVDDNRNENCGTSWIHLLNSNLFVPKQMTLHYKSYFGHFDWKRFFEQLAED